MPLEDLAPAAQEQIRREHPEQIEAEPEPEPKPTAGPAAATKSSTTRSKSSQRRMVQGSAQPRVKVQQPTLSISTPQASIGKEGFWVVVAMAALIGFLALITSHWTPGTLLSLVALVILGAIFPPAAVGLAAIVLLWLMLTHSAQLFSTLSGLFGATSYPQAASLSTSLGAFAQSGGAAVNSAGSASTAAGALGQAAGTGLSSAAQSLPSSSQPPSKPPTQF